MTTETEIAAADRAEIARYAEEGAEKWLRDNANRLRYQAEKLEYAANRGDAIRALSSAINELSWMMGNMNLQRAADIMAELAAAKGTP